MTSTQTNVEPRSVEIKTEANRVSFDRMRSESRRLSNVIEEFGEDNLCYEVLRCVSDVEGEIPFLNV